MRLAPSSNIDLYSDESIVVPYYAYRTLRDAGPVVFMDRHSIYALPRYDGVARALQHTTLFSSASGIAVSDRVNAVAPGTLIASDPPQHDMLRRAMVKPLMPNAVAALRPRIEQAATDLIAALVEKGSFDAVTDLARVLPVSIVSRLVGLPEEGRDNMLTWAAATFDLAGPDNERAAAAWPPAMELRAYAERVAKRGMVTAGSWADRLLDLADAGEVPLDRLPSLFRDFMAPSLDTTIFATASLFYLLGRHSDQWRLLTNDPSLVKNAVSEALRLESPIRGFTRRVTAACDIEGVELPESARVLLLYGSANRDERKWDDPETFHIKRRTTEHLGFGRGVHSCAGMHLARLEIESLLHAFIARVRSFTIGEPVWALNNTLRGLSSLPMYLEPR